MKNENKRTKGEINARAEKIEKTNREIAEMISQRTKTPLRFRVKK